MWTNAAFEKLSCKLPFEIDVAWDKSPSIEKYGHVNALLATIAALGKIGGIFLTTDKECIKKLRIMPLHRKITDQKKTRFSIIGLPNAKPLMLIELDNVIFEIYFNWHLFIETRTTFKQYFPSASVIVRPQNFLRGTFVSSPGSWGSDINFLTYDWEGTLLIETSPYGVPSKLRKQFKGFKYLPIPFKLFVAMRLSQHEMIFVKNNGFKRILEPYGESDEFGNICSYIQEYVDYQINRFALRAAIPP